MASYNKAPAANAHARKQESTVYRHGLGELTALLTFQRVVAPTKRIYQLARLATKPMNWLDFIIRLLSFIVL